MASTLQSILWYLVGFSLTLSHFGLVYTTRTSELAFVKPDLYSRATNESSLLECLEVTAPVLSPSDGCHRTLMVHTFASSYGQPYVGDYDPPDCDYNRVTINFTVTSAGRQFDRLALMFFGDIEIFRTSTAEPTQNGIIWSYTKDMSSLLSLFKSPQKIVFDLGNLIDDTYTGKWNTTLTATFFNADQTLGAADLILPISARKSATNASSAFMVPTESATNSISVPQNLARAVVSVSSCGQQAEEFWWSNVLSSDTNAFGNDTQLYGESAFREIQVLIDGNLAGVAWPFPVIFTGGVVPGFWRPIVGIDAFDLLDDEIDITPFIPLLSDGNPHTFEIRVVGIDDDGNGNGVLTEAIGAYWVVTGKIFLWLDHNVTTTAGNITTMSSPIPSIQLSSKKSLSSNGSVASLDYSVNVARNLSIAAVLHTSSGLKTVTWKQDLSFTNFGTLDNEGNDQVSQQTTSGTHVSPGYQRKFEYPLWVQSSYIVQPENGFILTGNMRRGKYEEQLGDLAYPNKWRTFDYTLVPLPSDLASTSGSTIRNGQNGTAFYQSVPAEKKTYGNGSTQQLYTLSRLTDQQPVTLVQSGANNPGETQPTASELYSRHIAASNGTIIFDEQTFVGQSTTVEPNRDFSANNDNHLPAGSDPLHEFAGESIQALIGRGPRGFQSGFLRRRRFL